MIDKVFSILDKEYQESLDTASKYPDSPMDEYIIMDECYRVLPSLIPEVYIQSVIVQYNDVVQGILPMNSETVRSIITAMYLSQV